MNKEIKIECPEGYEIDKENSTFECIKFIQIEKHSFENLRQISGWYINNHSIIERLISEDTINKNLFLTKEFAESSLAFAQITQLIERFYGGVVTKNDWKSPIRKYIINICCNQLNVDDYQYIYHPIAFHKREDRNLFLKEQQELLKQYFMIN